MSGSGSRANVVELVSTFGKNNTPFFTCCPILLIGSVFGGQSFKVFDSLIADAVKYRTPHMSAMHHETSSDLRAVANKLRDILSIFSNI